MSVRSRVVVASLAAVALFAGAACGGGDDGANESAAATTRPTATQTTATPGTKDLGRVVSLGEEFLLADVLALGIVPVASTATVSTAGFQGIPAAQTEGITPLPGTEPNFERLATFEPDTIVAGQFVIDAIGRDELDAIGELIVVPDRLSSAEQLRFLGKALGRAAAAEALIEKLNTARAAAAADGAECEVSVASIYPGPTPAAWVAEPNAVAGSLLELGCTLVPSAAGAAPDGSGRTYLSLEQLGQLAAPQLLLLQNDTVEGEPEALAKIEADPIWKQLPAVRAGNVDQLDRLGYPGATGRIRLYGDLAAIVGR